MKLYYSPGACSLAVHVVLRETERRFELERVDLRTHRTQRGRDYLAINPKGSVPALDTGTELLTEAQVILQYLGDLEPAMQLVPAQGTFARYRLQEWLSFLSSELHKQFAPLFHGEASPDYAAKVRGHIGEQLGYLQRNLATSAFLMGETFTVADAYAFALLRWCDGQGIDLQLYPNVAEYFERIMSRPSVISTFDAEGLPVRDVFRRSA